MSNEGITARANAAASEVHEDFGIIDIGSNTIRLVAYRGRERLPINVKAMPCLGDMDEMTDGSLILNTTNMATALEAIIGFRNVIVEKDIGVVQAIATAAPRDASNGDIFLNMANRVLLGEDDEHVVAFISAVQERDTSAKEIDDLKAENEDLTAQIMEAVAAKGRIDAKTAEKGDKQKAKKLAKLQEEQSQLIALKGIASAIHEAATASVTAHMGSVRAQGAPDIEPIRIIAGVEEAQLAGKGVVYTRPDANGLAGDLGGGSLELIRVKDGEVRQPTSLPIGSRRLRAIKKETGLKKDEWESYIQNTLLDGIDYGKVKTFYAIGGSWREFAKKVLKLDGLNNFDKPIPAKKIIDKIDELVAHTSVDKLMETYPCIDEKRKHDMKNTARLLKAVIQKLGLKEIVFCETGVREGLNLEFLSENECEEEPDGCEMYHDGIRFPVLTLAMAG